MANRWKLFFPHRQKSNVLNPIVYPDCCLWLSMLCTGFPWLLSSKELACNAGVSGDTGSIPGLGRSPGVGHHNPLHYSCQENPMDRGGLWDTVHRVAKSQMLLKWLSTLANVVYCTNTFSMAVHRVWSTPFIAWPKQVSGFLRIRSWERLFIFKQKDNEDIRSQGKEERIQKENFRVDKMNHFYQLEITTYQLQHEGSVTKKKWSMILGPQNGNFMVAMEGNRLYNNTII